MRRAATLRWKRRGSRAHGLWTSEAVRLFQAHVVGVAFVLPWSPAVCTIMQFQLTPPRDAAAHSLVIVAFVIPTVNWIDSIARGNTSNKWSTAISTKQNSCSYCRVVSAFCGLAPASLFLCLFPLLERRCFPFIKKSISVHRGNSSRPAFYCIVARAPLAHHALHIRVHECVHSDIAASRRTILIARKLRNCHCENLIASRQECVSRFRARYENFPFVSLIINAFRECLSFAFALAWNLFQFIFLLLLSAAISNAIVMGHFDLGNFNVFDTIM